MSVGRETHGAFKARLKQEGRWPEFLAVRKRAAAERGLKREADATLIVWRDFAPGTKAGASSGAGAGKKKGTPGKRAGVGGDAGVSADPDGGDTGGGVVDAGGFGQPEVQYVESGVFSEKAESSIRDDVQWVYDNLDVREPAVEDCPSAGAWALLNWVRSNRMYNQTEFYKSFVARLLPTRSDLVREEAHEDDGSSVDDTLRKLQRVSDAVQSSGAEGAQGES